MATVRYSPTLGASNKFLQGHGYPNSQVALFDAGIPGTLPRLNEVCVSNAIRTGIALQGTINQRSVFERKHYFYGDSPLGFQITQQRAPLVTDGILSIDMDSFRSNDAVNSSREGKSSKKKQRKQKSTNSQLDSPCSTIPFSFSTKNNGLKSVSISRIQIEQDTGRSLDGGGSKAHLAPEGYTLVDLNRAGVGLMEIVSEPDMETPEQTGAYVETLQAMLRHIGTSDGNMEEGSLRADINVSISKDLGSEGFVESPRVEIKNLNSVRHIIKAVYYECERLVQVYEEDPNSFLHQSMRYNETRSFDPSSGQTCFMRRKEGATDYRFFPEPDLPILRITDKQLDSIRNTMPELFHESLERLMAQPNNLKKEDAIVLLKEKGGLQFYDRIVEHLPMNAQYKDKSRILAANFLVNELLGILGKHGLTLEHNRCLSPKQIADIVSMLQSETISYKTGKRLLENILECEDEVHAASPVDIVEKNCWQQVSHEGTLVSVSEEVLSFLETSKKGRSMLEKYFNGQEKLFGFFFGQAMERLNGLAHPIKLRKAMQKALDSWERKS